MLTKEQAFRVAFHYLDKIYDENSDEALGDVLSEMNPYLFSDSYSADPAVWSDWATCISQITKNILVSPDEAYQAMILFVQFNQQEFGYDLANLLQRLRTGVSGREWVTCVNTVQGNK